MFEALHKSFSFNVEEACRYAREGQVEDWVHAFLRGPGVNITLSDGLKLHNRWWIGPEMLPLDAMERCCGPGLEFDEDQATWSARIDELAQKITSGLDVAPLIVEYRNGILSIRDGNHRHGALQLANHREYWTIIWFNSATDRECFQTSQDKHAQYESEPGG
jgi:hypothetical protein